MEKPETGDVLFIRSPEIAATVSTFVQSRIDPKAAAASRTFSHAAIVIGNKLALEAVPSPEVGAKGRGAGGTPREERGAWSGARLRDGVRPVPIADLVIPAMKPKADFAALRCPNPDAASLAALTLDHPSIRAKLGSEYSIEVLKTEAGRIFGRGLTGMVGGSFEWTSIPTDLASRLDLDPATREQIRTTMPDLVLPAAARTYFCSQLVIDGLRIAGLWSEAEASETITPTGLFEVLTKRGWADASECYRCAPGAERFAGADRAEHDAYYSNELARAGLGIETDALEYGIQTIKSGIEAANRIADAVMKKLPPSS